MSQEFSDVLDVESRVVSVEAQTEGNRDAATEATPVLPLEKSLVPAFDANKQIALANPAIVQLKALKAEIAEAKIGEIDVSTKEGEEKVRGYLKRCVKLRTGTEKAYDAWNRPLLDAQKGVRAIVKQVTEGISPEETTLQAIVEKIDAEREAEKQRLIEQEQARITALRTKIDGIQASLVAAVSMSSAAIDTKIRELQDLTVNDDVTSFGEFADEAQALRGNVISKLLEMSSAKRAAEEQQAALERQRQEQLERDRQAEIERGLRLRITALQQLAFSAMGKSAKDIEKILADLTAKEPLALEFGDLAAEAMQVWTTSRTTLQFALDAQKKTEEQQAENARVAREQAAERVRLAAAAAPAPTPTPTPAPTQAPIPAPVVDPVQAAGMDDTAVFAVEQRHGADIDPAFPAAHFGHDLIPTDSHAPPVGAARVYPALEKFASKEEYYEAVALRNLGETWGKEHASPNAIADDILNVLATGDFPTEQASELDLISLLLHESVLRCLRDRRSALIAAIENNEVTA